MFSARFLLPMPNGIIYFFVISKPGGTQKILLVPPGAGKRVEKGKKLLPTPALPVAGIARRDNSY